MKKIIKTIAISLLLSLIIPLVFTFLQLVIMKPMPLFEHSNVSLFIQPLIWGMMFNGFLGVLYLISQLIKKLLDSM